MLLKAHRGQFHQTLIAKQEFAIQFHQDCDCKNLPQFLLKFSRIARCLLDSQNAVQQETSCLVEHIKALRKAENSDFLIFAKLGTHFFRILYFPYCIKIIICKTQNILGNIQNPCF